jgi:short-subunit dehydrogenase
MKYNLKPVEQQVIVITGASSGIGLTTARMAATRGARVVLAARSEETLQQIASELGPNVSYVACDVGNESDLRRVAEHARTRFGAIDTWVNNAGVSIYGRLLEISMEDHRQLFETNYWGIVLGCRVACEYLRPSGGALINIGSTVSDRAVPLQGAYSASKHAVKGFTDALRMELEEEQAPISVTLIKPGSISTPFIDHAKSYMDRKPNLPPPVYAPENVAEAILHAAEHAVRDLFVGAGGKGLSAMGHYAPRMADKYMESMLFEQQKRDEAEEPRPDGLYEATNDPRERGPYPGYVNETSFYTKASIHPVMTGAVLLAVGLAASQLVKGRREKSSADREGQYLPTGGTDTGF